MCEILERNWIIFELLLYEIGYIYRVTKEIVIHMSGKIACKIMKIKSSKWKGKHKM